jgi:hypothetical protein
MSLPESKYANGTKGTEVDSAVQDFGARFFARATDGCRSRQVIDMISDGQVLNRL